MQCSSSAPPSHCSGSPLYALRPMTWRYCAWCDVTRPSSALLLLYCFPSLAVGKNIQSMTGCEVSVCVCVCVCLQLVVVDQFSSHMRYPSLSAAAPPTSRSATSTPSTPSWPCCPRRRTAPRVTGPSLSPSTTRTSWSSRCIPWGGMMYPVPGQPLPISMVHSLQYQEQLQVRIGRSVMQTGGDGQWTC